MTVNWANESDAVLITARDADAFATFYRRHAQGVLTFHARRTPSAELAADLTAETFAAALAGAERFDPERGEPVQWLYGIARHLLARALERGAADLRARKRLGIGRIELEDEMLERIEELASPRLPAGALDRAMDELEPGMRDAVAARVVGESDYEALARDAGTTPAAARRRVSRGLAALREKLGETD